MIEEPAVADAGPERPDTPPADGRGVLVIVPTYNERDNLPGLVDTVLEMLPGVRVLVVDDGSPDGTGQLADEIAAGEARVSVRHHRPRAGLGAAYVDAFTWVLAEHGAEDVRWIVQMDADGSHAPGELPRLLAGADGADVVLGSRYVPGGVIPDWTAHRRLLSWAGNVYSRRVLRIPVRDVTGGYRLFRREVLERLGVGTVASQGYCFQVDMVFRVHRAGFRLREVPITFAERAHGTSKMSGAVVREALWRVTSWGLRDRVRRAGRTHDEAARTGAVTDGLERLGRRLLARLRRSRSGAA